jgi:hypothetical protein
MVQIAPREQKAKRVAWLYPGLEKGGRCKEGKASATDGFSQRRLRDARNVLAHSRDLAVAMRGGPTQERFAWLVVHAEAGSLRAARR